MSDHSASCLPITVTVNVFSFVTSPVVTVAVSTTTTPSPFFLVTVPSLAKTAASLDVQVMVVSLTSRVVNARFAVTSSGTVKSAKTSVVISSSVRVSSIVCTQNRYTIIR